MVRVLFFFYHKRDHLRYKRDSTLQIIQDTRPGSLMFIKLSNVAVVISNPADFEVIHKEQSQYMRIYF